MTSPQMAGIEELINQSKRLGLIPSYRYGTAIAGSGSNAAILMAILDGDEQPTRVFNVTGGLSAGDRVFTVSVNPHGVYAIGTVNSYPREQFRTSRACTAAANLTSATTTLTGTSITVTGVPAGALYKGEVSVDFQAIGTTATAGVCQMFIDGVAASAQNALMGTITGNTNARATVSQTFNNFPDTNFGSLVNLAGGTHVFDLRAFRSGGADNQVRVNNIHTTLTLTLYW